MWVECLSNKIGGELDIMINNRSQSAYGCFIGHFSRINFVRLQLLLHYSWVHTQLVYTFPLPLTGLQSLE